jgi:nodulation protein E
MRRVAITGAGSVNALGLDPAATYAALRDGRSGIGRLTCRDAERLACPLGAEVRGFDPADHFTPQQIPRLDRFSQFALVAARQAMAQADLPPDPARLQRAGVIIGTGGGGLGTSDDSFRAVYQAGAARVSPLTVPRLMPSAAASQISMEFGLMGPVFSVSSACASSNHAIGLAFQMVRGGLAPLMLAGGADAMLTFGGLKAWEGLRLLSPDGCRPFSRARNGMVLGEGAGVFVLEPLDEARARGAPILAEIAGCSLTADAGDLVQPSQAGAVTAMRAALADAGLAAGAVGYVNAHGTGTRLNDQTEAAALHEVFGPDGPPVSSTKAAHGHAIGATGAIELLACLLALNEGVIAPTLGTGAGDVDAPVRLVTDQALRADVAACLSNAFAFGGLNAVLALRRA